MSYTPKPATAATAQANKDAVALYPMADRQDFDDAERGLIARFPGDKVVSAEGKVLFDLSQYDYIGDGYLCDPVLHANQAEVGGHPGPDSIVPGPTWKWALIAAAAF